MVLAWVMIGLAPVFFFSHLVSHAGAFELFSSGLDDLLVGYPTAFMLAIGGLILLGRNPA